MIKNNNDHCATIHLELYTKCTEILRLWQCKDKICTEKIKESMSLFLKDENNEHNGPEIVGNIKKNSFIATSIRQLINQLSNNYKYIGNTSHRFVAIRY